MSTSDTDKLVSCGGDEVSSLADGISIQGKEIEKETKDIKLHPGASLKEAEQLTNSAELKIAQDVATNAAANKAEEEKESTRLAALAKEEMVKKLAADTAAKQKQSEMEGNPCSNAASLIVGTQCLPNADIIRYSSVETVPEDINAKSEIAADVNISQVTNADDKVRATNLIFFVDKIPTN